MTVDQKQQPTVKQIVYLQKLLDARPSLADSLRFDTTGAMDAGELDAWESEFGDKRLAEWVAAPHDRKWVSALIDDLLKQPREDGKGQRPQRTEVRVTEVGMYRDLEGQIWKVQRSEAGRLYAKRLEAIGGERMLDATEEVVKFEFVYEPGGVYALTPQMRMTLEEAQQFGIRYGVCCVCGTPLSDATSVARGIGPVCMKRL